MRQGSKGGFISARQKASPTILFLFAQLIMHLLWELTPNHAHTFARQASGHVVDVQQQRLCLPRSPHQTMQEPSSTVGGEVRALWSTETTLLESLMYRNKNQHGRAGYWKRLQVRL